MKEIIRNGRKLIIEDQHQTPDGYDLVVVFQQWGNRCGYVGIKPTHPLYGKGYDDIDIDVHVGLTYANKNGFFDETNTIWYFGFDCGHLGDAKDYETLEKYGMITDTVKQLKAIEDQYPIPDDVVRTFEYVNNEVNNLYKQLSDYEHTATGGEKGKK